MAERVATAEPPTSMAEAKVSELSEEVMSEVHLGCPPRFSGPFVSHFTFCIPFSSENVVRGFDGLDDAGRSVEGQTHALDEDGDLVLPRRKKTYCVAIRHKITSIIPDVGLQVWKAALVLADFVLHTSITSSDFDDVSALELGAGTGFVGIILSHVSSKVFLTDRNAEILGNCSINVSMNTNFKHHGASILVRELDWGKPWPPNPGTCDFAAKRSEYSWTSSEIDEAERVSLLLAADVIYNDELTDYFFSVLESFMSRGLEKVLYLALEKRYNFSLEELNIIANGYVHFRSFLKDEEECSVFEDTSLPCFMGKLIDLAEVPQYIQEYERGRDLEIWRITYVAARNAA